jgi:magnesium-transporting ATPase (P-type)
LSAVFSAVIESRKISARLMAYVSYRIATTVQILTSLSVIVLAFNCEINTLYIILLALVNDLTMIPIAEDRQTASMAPIKQSINSLVAFSFALGFFQAVFSVLFYANMDSFLSGSLSPRNTAAKGAVLIAEDGYYCNNYAQSAIWLQISLSSELLIFVTRAPGHFFLSKPSRKLLFSTLVLGGVLCSMLAAYVFPGSGKSGQKGLSWADIGAIWLYDCLCLIVLDYIKLLIKLEFDHDTSGVLDEDRYAREDASENGVEFDANGNLPGSGGEKRDRSTSFSAKSFRSAASKTGLSGARMDQIADFLITGKKASSTPPVETRPGLVGVNSRQTSYFRNNSL